MTQGSAAISTNAPDTPSVVLGIETSCDETAASIVVDGHDVRSNVIATQFDLHAEFGGVVPEIAGRAHERRIVPVIRAALDEAGMSAGDVDAVAATVGPGLIGSLLVGVASAKALALSWDVPFVGVNHLEAHFEAALLDDPALEPPVVILLVSGGHTMLVSMDAERRFRLLGRTVDDAAGEAFDKVARFMDLGHPGGPVIDRLAAQGDPTAHAFPRAMMRDGLDFSFSGLKTAVINHVRADPDGSVEDVAASFQAAVVDVLVTKTRRAAEQIGANGMCLAGGVAANSQLRRALAEAGEQDGRSVLLPDRSMCTDNAAMVAAAGWYRLATVGDDPLDGGVNPRLAVSFVDDED